MTGFQPLLKPRSGSAITSGPNFSDMQIEKSRPHEVFIIEKLQIMFVNYIEKSYNSLKHFYKAFYNFDESLFL